MVHNTLADDYGRHCARVKALQNETDTIKAQLIALGESEIHGDLFKVVVTDTKPRTSVDWEALLACLEPSAKKREALKHRFASIGEPGVRVNAYALPRL